MIKRNELKGPSCLTNAAEDEPLFVLRANDEVAPDIVREWAYRYHKLKGVLTDVQRAKMCEAYQLAIDMELWRWRKGYGR